LKIDLLQDVWRCLRGEAPEIFEDGDGVVKEEEVKEIKWKRMRMR
jgi:hypothetical protein